MADTPITREEQYFAYLNGDSDYLPEPITRVEKYLYTLGINGVGVYSDTPEELSTSYMIKNKTLGIDITSQFNDFFNFKHIRIGKIHFLEIIGGKKIYNTTSTTYQINLTAIIPTYFSSGFELMSSKGNGITENVTPIISLGINQMTLTLSYTQSNSTSQYSPDAIYQIQKVLMFIEKS